MKRRSARWATRDYQGTSSVTQMLQDLNWRTPEQRRIDSRVTLMYKITYDLVGIPAADYLIPNTCTRQSRHNHLRSILSKSPHSKTATSTQAFRAPLSFRTLSHFRPLSYLLWHIQSCCVLGSAHLTVDLISNVLLPFNYTKSLPFTCIPFLNYLPLLFN